MLLYVLFLYCGCNSLVWCGLVKTPCRSGSTLIPRSLNKPYAPDSRNKTMQQLHFMQCAGEWQQIYLLIFFYFTSLCFSSCSLYYGQFIVLLSLFLCALYIYIFSYLRLLGKVHFAIKYYSLHNFLTYLFVAFKSSFDISRIAGLKAFCIIHL